MKPASRVSRLAVAIVEHLHEREILRAEGKVLDLLAHGAGGSAEAVQEADRRNRARLSVLRRLLIHRVAFAARATLKRTPAPVRKTIGAAARFAFNGLGRKARLARGHASDLAPAPAPAANPRAAAVPFGPAFPSPRPEAPVGVVAHLFYPELAAEMRGYLENIPGAVDLYVSTDAEPKRDLILQAFAGWSKGAVEARLAPNRGRDVAPKLITFRDVYARHPYVLHLHGKRSPHDSHLKLWRYFIYETLIGSPAVAGSILSAFDQAPGLGMVAPQHYYPIKNGIDWGKNLPLGQDLARRLGFELDPGAPLDFPAGSMFWARSAALEPLLDLDLVEADFAPEQGQADGTLAHAIERLYFHACERAGLAWMYVARLELAHEQAETATTIADLDSLRDFLRHGTVSLLPDSGRR